MEQTQYDALATLQRAKPNSLRHLAAKMHLVDGKNLPQIARELAPVFGLDVKTSYTQAWRGVNKAKAAQALCKIVVGTIDN